MSLMTDAREGVSIASNVHGAIFVQIGGMARDRVLT